MKLIDLLVQELPKRGGWPNGADYCVQDNDNSCDIKFGAGDASVYYDHRTVWVNDKNPSWGINTPESYIRDLRILASDAATAIVTREQYEAALQQPVWDGEGLPPVGRECERSWAGDKWLKCKILFVSNEHVVVKLATREAAYQLSEVKFRPIRSEAERKRDETITKMRTCLVGTGAGITEHASSCLYDAIARGDIPGIKLSD